MAALAKTPKERALVKNPGKVTDCTEKPRCKNADLDDPSEDLMEGVNEEAMEGHEEE